MLGKTRRANVTLSVHIVLPCRGHCELHLRQVLGSIALVGLDNLVSIQLGVGVSWVDDEFLGVVDDSESSEAIAGTELARPASADGVWAADVAAGALVGSAGAGNGELAGRGGRGVGVDGEGPGARGVGGVADTLHVDDGPLWGCGGHHCRGC